MKYFDEEDAIKEYEKQLQKKDNEIERLNLIIAAAIRIYENCEETQDYSTCDLDMYQCLKKVYKEDKKIEKFKGYIPIGLTSAGADFSKKDVFESLLKIGDKINEIIDVINRGDK